MNFVKEKKCKFVDRTSGLARTPKALEESTLEPFLLRKAYIAEWLVYFDQI